LGRMRGRGGGGFTGFRRVGNNSRCSSQSCIDGAASQPLKIRPKTIIISEFLLNKRKRSR
jgi:hypothetical protein